MKSLSINPNSKNTEAFSFNQLIKNKKPKFFIEFVASGDYTNSFKLYQNRSPVKATVCNFAALNKSIPIF